MFYFCFVPIFLFLIFKQTVLKDLKVYRPIIIKGFVFDQKCWLFNSFVLWVNFMAANVLNLI